MFTISSVHVPEEKAKVCDAILHALPDWFGIEASIAEYREAVQPIPFWAAYDANGPIGFIALKMHTPYASEICVMGILKQYHRLGIGRKLVETCEAFCHENNTEYLTVKTLDGSRESQSYAKTRQFYMSMGFRPLEVFPLHWDAANPCLFLAKYLPAFPQSI